MTRDSVLFKVGQAAAIVGAVLAVAVPSDYGFSEVTMRWVLLVCTLVGTLTGYLGTSPLPGNNEPPKSKRVGPRAGGFAILLAAALTVTSCASIGTPGVTPPVTPPAVSGPTEADIQATRAKALEIAKAVESIGQLVVEFRRSVSSAHAAGLVTLETRDAVNRAVIALEPKAVALVDVAKTVTTQQDLRAVTRALLDAVDAALGPVTGISDPTVARLVSGIRTALQVADLYLRGGGR